eukprot:GEZU01007357.1.p1 GENE.GEZU01007357.1~~GEZU01007357.1.p1  ORF type:complete len:316 (+),score=58.78 GEZU01007357.1:325-1272(+)
MHTHSTSFSGEDPLGRRPLYRTNSLKIVLSCSIILLVCLCLRHVSASTITITAGTTAIPAPVIAGPKYEILLLSGDEGLQLEGTKVPMMFNGGDKYYCTIPNVDTTTKEKESKQESPEGRQLALNNILESFNGTCFYRIAGWWIYEFCFNKHVKQFHKEQNTITSEFYLGYASAPNDITQDGKPLKYEVHKAPPTGSNQDAYISFDFKHGTVCDLTGTEREIEVRFMCMPLAKDQQSSMISAIEEPSTCKYRLIFHTDKLCKHADFKVEEEQVDKIYCVPVHKTNSQKKTIIEFEDANKFAPEAVIELFVESLGK